MSSNKPDQSSDGMSVQSTKRREEKELWGNVLGVVALPEIKKIDSPSNNDSVVETLVPSDDSMGLLESTVSRELEEVEKQFHLNSCIEFMMTGNLEELKARTLLCRYRDLPIQISETSFVHPTLVTPALIPPTLSPQISLNLKPPSSNSIPPIPDSESLIDLINTSASTSTIAASSIDSAPTTTSRPPKSISTSTSTDSTNFVTRWSPNDKDLSVETINNSRIVNEGIKIDWKAVAKVFEGKWSDKQCRTKVYGDKYVQSRLIIQDKGARGSETRSASIDLLDSIPQQEVIIVESLSSPPSSSTIIDISELIIQSPPFLQKSNTNSTRRQKVKTRPRPRPLTQKTSTLNEWNEDSLNKLILAIRDTPETDYKWTEIVRRVGGGRTVRECQAVWEIIRSDSSLANFFNGIVHMDKL